MADDLFTSAGDDVAAGLAPLAARMRPRTLDEVVGQQHLLTPGSPLRRLVEGGSGPARPVSVVLYGPPGTGKTSLAALVASAADSAFDQLSAVNAGVAAVRAAIDDARRRLGSTGRNTVLFIDEVHRFSRTQQDALLPAVENGWVTLIAATTENPSFALVGPLLSRSVLLSLQPLTDDDLLTLLNRALADERGLRGEVSAGDGALAAIVRYAGGDARWALTALEAAAGTAAAHQRAVISADDVADAVQRAVVRYDRAGDQHYDIASALIKSVRGSDADAALHYLARMIDGGEDPRFIARRLVILASEDVGLADPAALGVAMDAAEACAHLGLPEARLPLAQAVVYLALAPKSNAVIRAVDAALADVRAGVGGPVPPALRDAHYAGASRLGSGTGYRYPHDAAEGVVAQQYAPDDVVGREYLALGGHGAETVLAERWRRIRAALRGGPSDPLG